MTPVACMATGAAPDAPLLHATTHGQQYPRCPVHTQAGGYSVRRRRAAKPVAAPASPTLSAADIARYGQHPPHEGEHAAISMVSSRVPVINGTPARHPAPATGSIPLHGLDDIKSTRVRHDAPSPGQFCPVTEPPPGKRPRHPRVTGPPPATAQGGSSSRRYGAGNAGPDTTTAAGRSARPGARPIRYTCPRPGNGARRGRLVQEKMITLARRCSGPDRGRANGPSHMA